jgi:hypothetical protein
MGRKQKARKLMRKVLLLLTLALTTTPLLLAQNGDNGEVGVFADYFRLQAAPRDLFGVGARLSFNVHKNVQLEAEMAYDFERGFAEGFNDGAGTATIQPSSLRVLHGMFGPKFQVGKEGPYAIRAFVTAKGGFVNFGFSNASVASGFTSAIDNLRRDNNGNAVFYPGGGIEGYVGPIGLRLDVGDEIYFNNGANHNLKITFGPHIRF